MLQVSLPSIGEEELARVREVFASGWLGLGATVLEFENRLKAYIGAEHVIAVNTGTSALHIALDAFGVGPGDEVIVPSLTFVASIQAILSAGAQPVFCEVSATDLNLDLDDVERRITPRTKAIMPVHYCGKACDMDRLLQMGDTHKLAIVEDAAHALGSTYKGRRIGGFGHATCFSFDPIKTLTCGEGGAVALPDADVAEQIRRKRILGIDKETWHRYQNQRMWFYEVTTQGYRYHMSNINAAIGLAQMDKLEGFITRRQEIVAAYNREFEGLPGVRILDWRVKETAPFSYIFRVLNDRRQVFIDGLAERGVETGVRWIPNHTQPLFRDFGGSLPITEAVAGEILALPLYPGMTDAQVDQVIAAVRACALS